MPDELKQFFDPAPDAATSSGAGGTDSKEAGKQA